MCVPGTADLSALQRVPGPHVAVECLASVTRNALHLANENGHGGEKQGMKFYARQWYRWELRLRGVQTMPEIPGSWRSCTVCEENGTVQLQNGLLFIGRYRLTLSVAFEHHNMIPDEVIFSSISPAPLLHCASLADRSKEFDLTLEGTGKRVRSARAVSLTRNDTYRG